MNETNNKNNFVQSEEHIQKFWNEFKVFETSLEESKNDPAFTFYDGPPFATGLPHYGHILAGFIKDTICRYATMDGKYVQRIAGWDQHGLPIEYEIEKKLGIKTKKQIEELGLTNYNAACKEIVMSCADEWKVIMNRLGRWIDFEHAYKTSDVDFMSKTWSVFAKLYESGLIYEGTKVMPYSTACMTPLSNFEASSNYQDVIDETIIVKFPVMNKKNCYFLVWTTTPWTLMAHYALCVNPEMKYICIQFKNKDNNDNNDNNTYYIAEDRIDFLLEKMNISKKSNIEYTDNKYTILERLNGNEMCGMKYTAPYRNVDYYFGNIQKSGLYQIYADTFVTNESGTGIVHLAPAFGEEDFNVLFKNNVIQKDGSLYDHSDRGLYRHIGDDGRVQCFQGEWNGKDYKEFNKISIKDMKERNLIYLQFSYKHSYPFCWRSDTPLIYRAVKSWFLNVEKIKERMKELNKTVYWYPDYVGAGRFAQWLNGTRDWCISRNRYWGTPIPIWIANDGEKLVVYNKDHLEFLSGKKIDDLHRDAIDNIVIEVKGKKFKRISEIFDCWFESGSVPYASPTTGYPAQFIAEGLDQTRGWFYTLLVLGTALEDKSPYESVIVNGLVLASDGKKMSKRLKNYPDPMEVVNKYGSDALRFYLLTSVAVAGEPLRFMEDGVKSVLQNILIPLSNSVNFFVEYYRLFGEQIDFEDVIKTHILQHEKYKNETDYQAKELNSWIKFKTNVFVNELKNCYQKYTLDKIGLLVQNYVNDLNNVYIKLNRNDMKGKRGLIAQVYGLYTLYNVLKHVLLILAPILPFFTEAQNMILFDEDMRQKINVVTIWRGLKYESIHLNKFKNVKPFILNEEDNKNVKIIEVIKEVVDEIRNVRIEQKIPSKRPLSKVVIQFVNNQSSNVQYIYDYFNNNKSCNINNIEGSIIENECNIMELEFEYNANGQQVKGEKKYSYEYKLDFKKCGALFKNKIIDFKKFMESMNQEQLSLVYDNYSIYFDEFEIKNKEHVTIIRKEEVEKSDEYVVINKADYILKVYTQNNEMLEELYEMKNIASTFQKMRKEAKLHPTDDVRLIICSNEIDFIKKIEKHKDYIKNITRKYIEVKYMLDEYDVDQIIYKKYDFYILGIKKIELEESKTNSSDEDD
jgi:isoleucyl-tRNA synthetase